MQQGVGRTVAGVGIDERLIEKGVGRPEGRQASERLLRRRRKRVEDAGSDPVGRRAIFDDDQQGIGADDSGPDERQNEFGFDEGIRREGPASEVLPVRHVARGECEQWEQLHLRTLRPLNGNRVVVESAE